MMSKCAHELVEGQRLHFDQRFSEGARWHTMNPDELSKSLTTWRLRTAIRKLQAATTALKLNSSILIVGSAEGWEGSILCDLGYENVTVSDLSDVAVQVALRRDARLKGYRADLEDCKLPDDSFDVVIAQDVLHHLPRPINGFTEMLRVARLAVVFLEPHDSLVGRALGQKWEVSGPVVNYVFRWTRPLVQSVTSSYLATSDFKNLSFSFWHHNVHLERIGRVFGGGRLAINTIRLVQSLANSFLKQHGNQFCGLVVKSTA